MNRDILKNIPEELAQIDRWLNWRSDDELVGKYPVDLDGERIGWDEGVFSIKDCLKAIHKKPKLGLGFSLNDDNLYIVFDIDVKSISGLYNDDQLQLLEILQDTYIEKSPSGLGVHIWAKVDSDTYAGLPDGIKSSKLNVEFYKSKRFLTFTGEKLQSSPKTIKEFPKESIDLIIRSLGKSEDLPNVISGSVHDKALNLCDIFKDSAKCTSYSEFLEKISANSEHFLHYNTIAKSYVNDKGCSLYAAIGGEADSSSYDQKLANYIFGYTYDFKLSLRIFEDTDRFKKLLSETKKHGPIQLGNDVYHGYSVRTMIKATDAHIKRINPDLDECINSWLSGITKGSDKYCKETQLGKILSQDVEEKYANTDDGLDDYAKSIGFEIEDYDCEDSCDSRSLNTDRATELPSNLVTDLTKICKILRKLKVKPLFSKFLACLDSHAHTNYPDILTYVTLIRLSAPIGNCFSYNGYNCNINVLLGAPTSAGKNDCANVINSMLEYFDNSDEVNGLFEGSPLYFMDGLGEDKFSISQNKIILNGSAQAFNMQLGNECGTIAPTCFVHIAECYGTFAQCMSKGDGMRSSADAMFKLLIQFPELMSGKNLEKTVKASKDDQEEIVCPSISEYSETQTYRLDKLLMSSEGSSNGLLNRRIIVRIDDKVRYSIRQSSVIPNPTQSKQPIRDYLISYIKSVKKIRACCLKNGMNGVNGNKKPSILAHAIKHHPRDDDSILEYFDTIDSFFKNMDVINGTPHEPFKENCLSRMMDKIYKMTGVICVLRNIDKIDMENNLFPEITMEDAMLGSSLVLAPYFDLYEQSKMGTYDEDGVKKNAKLLFKTYHRFSHKYSSDGYIDKLNKIENVNNFKTKLGYLCNIIDRHVGADLRSKEPFSRLDNAGKRKAEYDDTIYTLCDIGVLRRISQIEYLRRIEKVCKEHGLKIHPEMFKVLEEYELRLKDKDFYEMRRSLENTATSRIYAINNNVLENYIQE